MPSGDPPRSHFYDMSNEQKKRAGTFLNGLYKLAMSGGMAAILFNIGAWKVEVDQKTFESPQEKFEYMDQVDDAVEDISYVKEVSKVTAQKVIEISNTQTEYKGEIEKILTAIEDLDKKTQWNFNRINNQ